MLAWATILTTASRQRPLILASTGHGPRRRGRDARAERPCRGTARLPDVAHFQLHAAAVLNDRRGPARVGLARHPVPPAAAGTEWVEAMRRRWTMACRLTSTGSSSSPPARWGSEAPPQRPAHRPVAGRGRGGDRHRACLTSGPDPCSRASWDRLPVASGDGLPEPPPRLHARPLVLRGGRPRPPRGGGARRRRPPGRRVRVAPGRRCPGWRRRRRTHLSSADPAPPGRPVGLRPRVLEFFVRAGLAALQAIDTGLRAHQIHTMPDFLSLAGLPSG